MMVIAAEKRPAPGFLNAFDYTKQGQMFDAAASAGSFYKRQAQPSRTHSLLKQIKTGRNHAT